jgi:hypothetical protein
MGIARGWVGGALAALVFTAGCSGSSPSDKTSCPDGGNCSTPDGGGTGGSGGSGGATLCQQTCGKLGVASCPQPFDEAGCVQTCVDSYTDFPDCAVELDSISQCLIVKGVASCDASGQAAYLDGLVECKDAYDAFNACTVPGGTG